MLMIPGGMGCELCTSFYQDIFFVAFLLFFLSKVIVSSLKYCQGIIIQPHVESNHGPLTYFKDFATRLYGLSKSIILHPSLNPSRLSRSLKMSLSLVKCHLLLSSVIFYFLSILSVNSLLFSGNFGIFKQNRLIYGH